VQAVRTGNVTYLLLREFFLACGGAAEPLAYGVPSVRARLTTLIFLH
jgi:hypothetical protein